MDDYKNLLKERILDDALFVHATFKARQRGHEVPWQRVELRPVMLKRGRHVQVSYFDDVKHIAKNYAGQKLAQELDDLLDLPFRHWQVETTNGRLQIEVTKKGKVIVHKNTSSESKSVPLSLQHDRQKKYLLPDNEPTPFLQATNVMTNQGKVRADMRRKFRQVNQFLKLISETVAFNTLHTPIRVVDFGCGNATLTFAIYHYLFEIKGLPTRLDGVDIKTDLIKLHNDTAHKTLAWHEVQFHDMPIEAYSPKQPPDIVLALHACDIATDAALAKGISSGSHYIFCVPCCHHDLQVQLQKNAAVPLFEPMFDHGILRERFGDMLTDTFRAQLLRIMGYHTDIVEFISAEHTPKNLMIRAIKTNNNPNQSQYMEAYKTMKEYWQVTPYLETQLAMLDEYKAFFSQPTATAPRS